VTNQHPHPTDFAHEIRIRRMRIFATSNFKAERQILETLILITLKLVRRCSERLWPFLLRQVCADLLCIVI